MFCLLVDPSPPTTPMHTRRSDWSPNYQQPYTPSPGQVDPTVDMKTPVREQVNRMDAGAFSHESDDANR